MATGRSTTGDWVVEDGPFLVGPFDGRSSAEAFVRSLRRLRPDLARPKLRRVFPPVDARRWAESTSPKSSASGL